MAIYNPPTEILPIFNIENWEYGDQISLTQSAGDLRYLRLTGGTERGNVTFNEGLVSNGTVYVGDLGDLNPIELAGDFNQQYGDLGTTQKITCRNAIISNGVSNTDPYIFQVIKTAGTDALNIADSGDTNILGDLNLSTGKVYRINGASVLSATALGSSVVGSSLTSVGTLSGLNATGIMTLNSTTGSGSLKVNSSANYTNTGQGIYLAMQGGSIPAIFLCSDTANNRYIQFSTANGSNGTSIQSWGNVTSTMDIRFYTNGNNERMRITGTGLVGIGRTPTTYPLEVQGDILLTGDIVLKTSGATPSAGELGYRYILTPADTNLPASTTLLNITNFTLSAGVWSVIAYFRLGNTSGNTTVGWWEVGFSINSGSLSYTDYPLPVWTSGQYNQVITFGTGATYPSTTVSTFLTLSASSTYYVNGRVSYSGGTGAKFTNMYLHAVRVG